MLFARVRDHAQQVSCDINESPRFRTGYRSGSSSTCSPNRAAVIKAPSLRRHDLGGLQCSTSATQRAPPPTCPSSLDRPLLTQFTRERPCHKQGLSNVPQIIKHLTAEGTAPARCSPWQHALSPSCRRAHLNPTHACRSPSSQPTLRLL